MDAQITDDVRATLRAALGAAEPEWLALLQPLLDGLSTDVLGLMRVRSFLVQHHEAAGERFRERLERMIAAVEQQLRQAAGDGVALEQVAAEVVALQAQRAGIQEEIDRRRELLEIAVGHGQKLALSAHRVSVSTPGVSLRIVDAEQVPPAFLRPQPDRKAIMAHFAGTGEVLPGTELGPRKAAVTVKALGGTPAERE